MIGPWAIFSNVMTSETEGFWKTAITLYPILHFVFKTILHAVLYPDPY